jgi:pyridinium-3,5-biscarboxylic acid mononucleotide sulfurtransferase
LAEGERVVEERLAAAGHEDFPFRLRFCDTNRHELHLGREIHSMPLLEELDRALCAAGFSCIRVLHMRDLSGYFDRTNAGPET